MRKVKNFRMKSGTWNKWVSLWMNGKKKRNAVMKNLKQILKDSTSKAEGIPVLSVEIVRPRVITGMTSTVSSVLSVRKLSTMARFQQRWEKIKRVGMRSMILNEHLMLKAQRFKSGYEKDYRSEERRVGKEC